MFSARMGLVLLPLILFTTYGLADAPQKGDLLILGPKTGGFGTVMNVIRKEVSKDYNVHFRPVDQRTGYETFDLYYKAIRPSFLILMENTAIDFYRYFQKKNPDLKPFPPAIACMALFISEQTGGIENAVGISYELPPVLMVTQLRHMIEQEVKTLGVVYRDEYHGFIQRQKKYCEREGITIVGFPINKKEEKVGEGIKKGLRYLIKKQKVDALWVLNDNVLLTQDLVDDVWAPRLKFYKKPILVGVERLSQDGAFGNFGVYPDHQEIGHQVVDMVYDYLAHGTLTKNVRVEEPRAIITMLDLDFAKKYLGLKEKDGPIQ